VAQSANNTLNDKAQATTARLTIEDPIFLIFSFNLIRPQPPIAKFTV